VLYLLVGIDLHLGAGDGAILFFLLLAYLRFIWLERRNGATPPEEDSEHRAVDMAFYWEAGVLLLFGLVLVGVASHFLIESASSLARSFGVSEWAIAVTVVAAGTSVPEMATTLAGVVRGHTAISAGNVIGSDIFNVLGVLGVAGMLHPMSLDPAARVSLLALTGMVIVVFLMMRTGWRVSRLEGATLVALAAIRWFMDVASRT
jgi:cation:H+ antiporter